MASRSEASHVQFTNQAGNLTVGNTFNMGGGGRIAIGGSNDVDNDVAVLQSLPYARGAEYNAYERRDDELLHNALCHEGTRVALLKKITAWTAAHDAHHVFWLYGLAGTGKSTIARTIARRCADDKRLGASFFFTRGGGDLASARKFVTTVAVQLAAAVPAVRPHISKAAGAVRDLAALALQDQWEKLVLQPLAKVGRWKPRLLRKPLVIVVDALDECDRDSDSAAVLGLLSLGATGKESWLRVLLTSRPETPIRYGIQAIPSTGVDRFTLHEIEPPLVDHDIAVYFQHQFRHIGMTFFRNSDWPGDKVVDLLVNQAGGLFIWAATAYRFIKSGGVFANDRLQEILGGASADLPPQQSLDRIYLTVLDKAVSGEYTEPERLELLDAVHTVIASIAVLAAPLDINALSHLVATTYEATDKALHGLHSILDVPDNLLHPIRLHHASFRDFIVNLRRCDDPRFAVDGPLQHKILAESCLCVMVEHLRQDICDLRGPGVRVNEVDGRRIERHLPSSLQYACCYWATHVLQSDGEFMDHDGILAFLHKHLLHWLEALSVLGRLAVAMSALAGIEQLPSNERCPDLKAFAHDARLFLLSNIGIIGQAPLQVYCSALVFAPLRSLVRQRLLCQLPQWISRLPQVRQEWGEVALTIDTNNTKRYFSEHRAMAFTTDGQSLVFRQGSSVRLWDPVTGALRGAYVPPTSDYTPTSDYMPWCLSPDASLLAHVDYRGRFNPRVVDLVVHFWDTRLLTIRSVLVIQVTKTSNFEECFKLSPNGDLLTMSVKPSRVTLCDTKTTSSYMTIDCVSAVYSVAFSGDGRILALQSRSQIEVWDVRRRRERVSVFQVDCGNRKPSRGIFSPAGNLFAIPSGNGVRLWQVGENIECNALEGHLQAVGGIAFSPDGRLLISVSHEELIVWELSTGARRYSIPNEYRNMLAPVMSPNGQLFAWQTGLGSVGLWYAETGLQHSTFVRRPSAEIEAAMAFSHDSRLFAWAREGGIVSVVEVSRLSSDAASHNRAEVAPVIISFDGQRLITSNYGIRLWDLAESSSSFRLGDHNNAQGLAVSHNGLRLAGIVQDTMVVVDNILRRGDSFAIETSHRCSSLALSFDGRLLAICSPGGVELHEMDKSSQIVTFPGDEDGVQAAAFSRDRRRLAAVLTDRTHIWDVDSRILCAKLRLHGAIALAFSPDGQLIVGSMARRLELWHLATATCVGVLRLEALYEPWVDFSSDGRQLVTTRGNLAVVGEREDSSAPEANALAHFYVTGQWITYACYDVLWLPPDYRPSQSAMHDNTFAWIDANGDGDFIEFDPSKIPQAGPHATVESGCYAWKKPEQSVLAKGKQLLRRL